MVIWSEPAKKDLRQIFEYIARDSRYYAKKAVNNIVEKSMSLDSSPRRGRIVPEINDPDIREIYLLLSPDVPNNPKKYLHSWCHSR